MIEKILQKKTMMKSDRIIKMSFLMFIFFTMANDLIAQKIGFVNTKEIMSKMEEVKEVEDQLKLYRKKWDQEIKKEKRRLDSLEKTFFKDKILLLPSMIAPREKEITEQLGKLKALQEKYYGVKGLLFIKRNELLQPIRAKVIEAVYAVAEAKEIHFIFDRSAEDFELFMPLPYADPINNYNDYVFKELKIGETNETLQD